MNRDRTSVSATLGDVDRPATSACGVASPSTTASATAFIVVRRSIAVRWIQRNASGSVICWRVISRPFARSTTLRVSSRSLSVATSSSSARFSANRETASSIAGTSSWRANGFTR